MVYAIFPRKMKVAEKLNKINIKIVRIINDKNIKYIILIRKIKFEEISKKLNKKLTKNRSKITILRNTQEEILKIGKVKKTSSEKFLKKKNSEKKT